MKKKLIVLIAPLLALSGCDYINGHTHSFNEEWTTNESMHWHEASCEHNEYSKDLGTHTYNADGFCSFCNYETPEHFREFEFNGVNCSLQQSLDKAHLGDTLTLNIVPNENCLLPTSITATGLDNLNYDKDTGVITGSVVSDVTIKARCKNTAVNYYLKSLDYTLAPGLTNYIKGYQEGYEYNPTENAVIKNIDINNKDLGGEFIHEIDYETTKFDQNNRVIKFFGSNENNEKTNGYSYEYDDQGRLSKKIIYSYSSGEEKVYKREIYVYDEQDRIVTETYYYGESDENPESKTYVYFDGYYTTTYAYYDYQETELSYNYNLYETTIDTQNNTRTETVYYYTESIEDKIFKSSQTFDLTTNKLLLDKVGSTETAFEYNNNGDIVSIKDYVVDGEAKTIVQQLDYTYNNDGLLTKYTAKMIINNVLSVVATCIIEYDELDFVSKVTVKNANDLTILYINYEYMEHSSCTALDVVVPQAYTYGNFNNFIDLITIGAFLNAISAN